MDDDKPHSEETPHPASPEAASELNNLLQIIAGTTEAMENIWEGSNGSEKYFTMLRSSVDRAAQLTATLVEQAGGSDKKVLLHPALTEFARRKEKREQPAAQRILAVDDEPMALMLSKQIFAEAGFEVQIAKSGFECLDLVRTRPAHYDLVLLDLSMPFMDGEETFERLRHINPNIVVLLNTGFVDQERLDRMLANGLSGFIRKPHRPSELVAQVRAVLKTVKLARAGCAVHPSAALR